MTEFLDIGQVAKWLEPRGLLGPKRIELLEEVDTSRLVEVRSFWIPDSALAMMVLGKALADLVADEQEVLLYVDDWGASESGQDFNLFNRFRQGLGETATVIEKPAQLFYSGEFVDLISMFRLTLCLDWGTYLIPSPGDLVIEILQDDWARLYAAAPAEFDAERLAWVDEIIAAHPGT